MNDLSEVKAPTLAPPPTAPRAPVVVDAAVQRVTCLEDRAQVERRGSAGLAAGASTVVLRGISALAVDRSLKVELSGATLVDARVRRAWLEKPSISEKDPSALRQQEKELADELAQLAQEQERATIRLELIRTAHADLLRAISETVGAGTAKPAEWPGRVESLRAEELQTLERIRQLQIATQRAANRHTLVRQAIAASEAPQRDLETSIELQVDADQAGTATVKVSYLVPCAVWRPAYRATLASRGGAEVVTLESDAMVWQQTGEEWKDIELWLSTARPTLGAAPPTLTDDRLTLRQKSEQERKVVEVSVREEAIRTAGEGGGASELPGLDDGGEVRILVAPQKVTLPSDGQPHRVHLGRFEAPAQSELVCAPEQSALVSLVARFDNVGRTVLLAGPVELVRNSGAVGKTQLKFAGVGEQVKLAFGSEDGLRVGRDVLTTEDESRLTGRRTSKKTVKLFASNFGGSAARVVIEERIPVSEVKEVEISPIQNAQPAPSSVSKDGIARFEVALAPRQQQELRFGYEISASGKVAGL